MPMSAAEPATPERGYLNARSHGAVIDITKRRAGGRGAAAEAQGRWNAMSTPPGHGSDRTPIEAVADDMEAWFLSVQRSLTDPETAFIYRRTVEIVEHLLKGAVAKDLITEEQRTQLADILEAARQAPDHL